MARILYWNIENFSLNKINNADYANRILDVFTQINPDIFVIVEVQSIKNPVAPLDGTLILGNAVQGVLNLLNNLRNIEPNWCLIPPLNSGIGGYREGIAVYYHSVRIEFTGPYVWNQNNVVTGVGRSEPYNPVVPNNTDYQAVWNNCLPVGNVVNNPVIPTRGLPFQHLAGQYEFLDVGGVKINFPGRNNRSPFLTTFYDRGARRRINLFSFHDSPNSARQAVQNLRTVQEIENVGNNEVSVIVGDFNVDTFSANANCYDGLILNLAAGGLDYTVHLDPRDPATGNTNNDRQPYCVTHCLRINEITPFNTNGGVGPGPRHDVYPRYGYMGTLGRRRGRGGGFIPVSAGALDNIFTRYGGGRAVAPANYNMTVVNPFVGSPYNGLNGIGAGPPVGVVGTTLIQGIQYNRVINVAYLPPPSAANQEGGIDSTIPLASYFKDLFKNDASYILGTSDHLPLAIDI